MKVFVWVLPLRLSYFPGPSSQVLSKKILHGSHKGHDVDRACKAMSFIGGIEILNRKTAFSQGNHYLV